MSNFRDKYKQQKKDLLRRHEESVTDKSSGVFGSVWDLTKAPKTVGFWKCTEASHTVDFIPFIAGDNLPRKSSRFKEGEFAWGLEFWSHGNVGALEEPFVCPSRTNGEPCPICEHLQQNRGKYSKEEYDSMKAKRRMLYLIWCHDNSEEERKGVQLWEVAHWFMEDKLKVIAERPKGGGTIPYFDPDNGKHVVFTRRGTGAGNTQYLGHRFDDRDTAIPDSILDQSFPLDSLIKYATYEEIYKAFYGKAIDADAGDTISETSLPVDAEPEDITPFDLTDTDDNSDSVVDEIAPDVCPVGGEFGMDFDQLEACNNDCPNWDNCYAANAEMKPAEPEPEPEPDPPARKPSPAARLRATSTPEAPAPIKRPTPIPRRRA